METILTPSGQGPRKEMSLTCDPGAHQMPAQPGCGSSWDPSCVRRRTGQVGAWSGPSVPSICKPALYVGAGRKCMRLAPFSSLNRGQ